MVAEIGQFSLILAFLMALVQAVPPLIGASRRNPALMGLAWSGAVGQFIFITTSFFCLVYAFAVSDFTVANVVENSHSTKPMVYKLTGAWANHEGSMVLWVLILAVFGLSLVSARRRLPDLLGTRVLAIQGMIGACFLLFILLTSNPFMRVFPPAADGNGLNPLLQDPGLVLHPPFLYLGYVGFSVTFSFAVAALIEGKVDAVWAHWVRPWALAAWAFLTVGIALGSWWAYYELGWGGWWYWDPVENASFMPWLAGTALLHSAIVAEKRDALKTWTVLLAILAFSMSLIGTFLVRSGILTSVHAFAVDPARGVFILALLLFAIGGSLTLFAIRAPQLKPTGVFAPVSREGSLVLNNLLMIVACATVFLGTFYPLFMDAVSGEKISVGPPYFNSTFVPLMIPLLLVMVLGPMLAWKRGNIKAVANRLKFPILIALAFIVLIGMVIVPGQMTAVLGFAMAAWVVIGSFAELASKIKLFQIPIAASFARLGGLSGNVWGTFLAHLGVGILVAGITGVSVLKVERIEMMAPGQTTEVAGFEVTLDKVEDVIGPNYTSRQAVFTVREDGDFFTSLISEKRFYNVRQMETTEAGIETTFRGDVYLTVGDQDAQGNWTVRLYYNPLVVWMWLGSAVMVLGGLVSLSDRRLRVGAPKRSRNVSANVEGARS